MTAATPEQIENIKNRLGLATETTTVDDIVAELQRLRTKSTATQKATPLSKEDYELFGVEPSPNL